MTGPSLSVVVAWQEGSAGPCLAALGRQRGVGRGEIEIVLAGEPHGRGAVEEPDPASGALLREAIRVPPPAGPDGRSLPRLLGAGAVQARAPWVAFTETCCTPADDWAASLLAACARSSAAAVGGAVEPARGLSAVERALAVCDYAPFFPPFAAGPLPAGDDLPGNNVAFRRNVLPPAARLEREGFWKTFHCRELERQGERLARDPRPLVHVGRRTGPGGAVRRRLRHGRCFGGMRAAGLGRGRRAAVTLAAPVLPAVLTARTLGHLRRAGRLDAAAVRLVPAILALHAVWIAGESIGNLSGTGDACLEL